MIRALFEISDHADLHNADGVLMYIGRKEVKDSFKANLIDFYRHYADFYARDSRHFYATMLYHRTKDILLQKRNSDIETSTTH